MEKKNLEDGPVEKILKEGQNMKDLAAVSGIKYRTLVSYNCDGVKPSLENAVKIAKAQQISLVRVAESFGLDVAGLPYA
jgi:DNA-binding XRE family transcriptional regulator